MQDFSLVSVKKMAADHGSEKQTENWPSRGVHFDLRVVSVSKVSFSIVSD